MGMELTTSTTPTLYQLNYQAFGSWGVGICIQCVILGADMVNTSRLS